MKKVILDTDLGCDSDDIGAIVILNQLYNQKKVLPLLITSVNSNIEPALMIDEINKFYSNDILIGINKSNDYGINNGYAVDVVNKYQIANKDFISSNDAFRTILEEQDEAVELITIGPLTNVASFCSTDAGAKLLNEKVKTIYLMAGNFVSNNPEWNITEDICAFKTVLKKYTGKMVFIPFEIGCDVFTARNLLKSDTLMGYGYYVHNKGPRQSWDPITVYYAITLSDDFSLSNKGTVLCDDNGVTTFKEGEGNHYYMLNNFDKEKIEGILEDLMIG